MHRDAPQESAARNLPRLGLVLDNKGLVLDRSLQLRQLGAKRQVLRELDAEVRFLRRQLVHARDSVNDDRLAAHPRAGEPAFAHAHRNACKQPFRALSGESAASLA